MVFCLYIYSYIRDNQVYGDCTPETYIHALRTGCRAVESKHLILFLLIYVLFVVDCYDGDHMEPIVYHGNTLTKPITFREIIHAIETQAFSVSP
jgi:phosphatidylinositol phospholipase C delta